MVANLATHGKAYTRHGRFWRKAHDGILGMGQLFPFGMTNATSNGNRILTPPKILNPYTMVNELINHEERTWRIDLVRQIFNPPQAAEVLNIPLGKTNQRDYLV